MQLNILRLPSSLVSLKLYDIYILQYSPPQKLTVEKKCTLDPMDDIMACVCNEQYREITQEIPTILGTIISTASLSR